MPWKTGNLSPSIWHQLYLDTIRYQSAAAQYAGWDWLTCLRFTFLFLFFQFSYRLVSRQFTIVSPLPDSRPALLIIQRMVKSRHVSRQRNSLWSVINLHRNQNKRSSYSFILTANVNTVFLSWLGLCGWWWWWWYDHPDIASLFLSGLVINILCVSVATWDFEIIPSLNYRSFFFFHPIKSKIW